MKRRILLLTTLVFLSFFSYRITYAFLISNQTITGNTISTARAFPTPTPDLTNIANHIVISEVQIATSGATTSDFVELYNPTSSNINLNGFHLVRRASTGTPTSFKAFSSSNIILGHGFYLWANSAGGYATQINADVSTNENIADNNSVALTDNQDLIVDQVAWGAGAGSQFVEGSAFATNPGSNQSIERKAYSTSTISSMTTGVDVLKGNGFDSNDNANDFILRPAPQPQNSSSPTESP